MVCFVKWYERPTISQARTRMTYIETESEDNSIVALPCEICGELCPSDKLMEHQEQCILEGEGVQGSGSPSENEEPSHRSDRLHFRFSLESDGQWERR